MASQLRSSAVQSTFKTQSNITIVVEKDITNAFAYCVFRPVNHKLKSGDGVSRTIDWVMGKDALGECDKYMKDHKYKKFPMLKVCSTGGDRWPRVYHARVSKKHWKGDPQRRCEELKETILRCLKKANKEEMTSIVLPSVRIEATSVTAEDTAKCYIDAIIQFDKDFGGKTCLKRIVFVDDKQDYIDTMVKKMQREKLKEEYIDEDNTLRIVLVGRSGVGKSRTANSLIGQDFFKSVQQLYPVTGKSTIGYGDGIQVVDTPGLFDTKIDAETNPDEILKEILKAIFLTLPGPHVFLLLLSANDRFDQPQVDLLQKMRDLFGEKFHRFLVVVFTNCLDEEMRKGLLVPPTEALSKLLKDCKDRVLDIENGSRTRPVECKKQAAAIIKMASELRENNRKTGDPYYQNDVLKKILWLLEGTTYKDKSFEEIKRKADEIVKSPDSEKMLKDLASRRSLCTIL